MQRVLNIRSWRLSTKLSLFALLMSIIPIIILSSVNTALNRNAIEQELEQGFVEDADARAESISNFLQQQITLIQSIALNEAVQAEVIARNAGWRELGGESIILAEITSRDSQWINGNETTPLIAETLSTSPQINAIGSQLSTIQENFSNHVEIFVTDQFGATVASTALLSDYYQADEGWWTSAFADGSGAVYLSDPEFDESTNTIAILIAVPIFGTGDEVIGVVRSTFDIGRIVQETEQASFGQTGQVFLMDRNAQLITASGTAGATQFPEAITQRILSADEGGFIANDEVNEQSIFGFSRMRELDNLDLAQEAINTLNWSVLVREKGSEAFAPLAQQNLVAVALVVVFAIVVTILAIALSRFLTRQVRVIQGLFGEIQAGELNSRAAVLTQDELGDMAVGLNQMLDNTVQLFQETESARNDLQSSVIKLLNEVADVADGDLTIEAEVTADATGAIADSFNYMVTELRQLISRVQDATQQVSYSALNIQETTETLAQRSEMQAVELASASSEISNMATTMQRMSNVASESASVGERALTSAQRGNTAVQATISGMGRIREQVQETAKRIKRLGESSQEIGEIVQLINELSDRTSILALNASIQAAMAGEAGKGFAVVAEEVEQLAERASQSTREIGALISTIQSETNEAVAAMEAMTGEVVRGSEVANEAGQALVEIENISVQLSELIGSISQATAEQADSSLSLAEVMNRISTVIQENAAGTKNTADSINEMADLANALRSSVSTFKLPATNGSSNGAYA